MITPEEFDALARKNKTRINFIDIAVDLYGMLRFSDAEKIFRTVHKQNLFTDNFNSDTIDTLINFYDKTPKKILPYIHIEPGGEKNYGYLDLNAKRKILWIADFKKEVFASILTGDLDEILEIQSIYPIYIPDENDTYFSKKYNRSKYQIDRFFNDATDRFIAYICESYSLTRKEAIDVVRSIIVDSICVDFVFDREYLMESIDFRLFEDKLGHVDDKIIQKNKKKHEEMCKDFYNNLRMWKFSGHTYNEIKNMENNTKGS